MTTKRITGNRKRKTTGKQMITYFRLTLEAPGNPASDTDAHLDKSTIIFTIKKLQTCKPKQDSDTRPRRRQQKEKTNAQSKRPKRRWARKTASWKTTANIRANNRGWNRNA
jgi:hypothetical protein